MSIMTVFVDTLCEMSELNDYMVFIQWCAVLYAVFSRERTDLGTDSDSAPISVDRNRIQSNIRSVIDPSAICRPRYQLLHRMPPKPYNHKWHKAVIAICRVYKVPCRRREGEAVPCTASASAVWIGSINGMPTQCSPPTIELTRVLGTDHNCNKTYDKT